MVKKGFLFFSIILIVLGLSVVSCDNGTTPDEDIPTRWVSITGLDRIGLSSFTYSVLLSDGETIGLIYEIKQNEFPDGLPGDATLTCPLVTSVDFTQAGNKIRLEYKFWHGSGDYYVYFIVYEMGNENKIHQRWKSNELIHFSDDSPKPTLSLYDTHLFTDE